MSKSKNTQKPFPNTEELEPEQSVVSSGKAVDKPGEVETNRTVTEIFEILFRRLLYA